MMKHYSGEASGAFWQRIRALPDPQHDILYLLGCTLQDLESRVLQLLEQAEPKPTVTGSTALY